MNKIEDSSMNKELYKWLRETKNDIKTFKKSKEEEVFRSLFGILFFHPKLQILEFSVLTKGIGFPFESNSIRPILNFKVF